MSKEMVEVHNNVPVTTSLKIAEYFEKRHDNVIRDIADLIADIEETASDQDALKNEESAFFIKSTYVDVGGRRRKMYYVTEDGFNLLAMGFTGKKALKFKLAFLAEFKRLKDALANRDHSLLDYATKQRLAYQAYKPGYHVAMSAVRQLIDYAVDNDPNLNRKELEEYLYPLVNGSINRVLGIPKGQRPDVNPLTAAYMQILNREVKKFLQRSISEGHSPIIIIDNVKVFINSYGQNLLDEPDHLLIH